MQFDYNWLTGVNIYIAISIAIYMYMYTYIHHNQRQRHWHNYALPEITFIWQRDRLDQEKPQQQVRRNYGQLRRSGSLWAYRTFPPEQSQREILQNNVGLYRDDGLVLLTNATGPQSEQTRKDVTREFKKQGLNIPISTNHTTKVHFNKLDTTKN